MISQVVRYGWSGPYPPPNMERNCTVTLGSRCHGLSVLMGKRFILISSENLSSFNLCPLSLFSHVVPLCRAWFHLLHYLPVGVGELLFGAPKAVLPQGWTKPTSACPHRETAPGPHQRSGPTLHLIQFFHVSRVLEDQNWVQCSIYVALINTEWKEITSFVNLQAMPLLIQPGM